MRFAATLRALSPAGWVGPIFTKELRVVSRRRRHYLLRAGYLAALTLFVAIVWISAVGGEGSSAAQSVYRMSTVGKAI
ncbi:MAG TPA: hypothetical protein VMZ50_01290, partial [Phycisphaerae bacterium]|nr:hypothetical protein [Phycisphaerae bacterium]